MNSTNANALGYVVVTDYLEANTGKDVSDAIQSIIDSNPMKTIYFPDGEYILAKPICTSGKPRPQFRSSSPTSLPLRLLRAGITRRLW